MSRSILEILREDTNEEADWLMALGASLQEQRSWMKGSLAQAEFDEGLYVDDEEAWELANQATVSLAAEDTKPLGFPTEYQGGPWRIVLKRLADGRPALRIDQGRENAEVLIQDEWVHIRKGQELVVDLEEPPLQLRIRVMGEGSWLIWPR